MSQATQSWIRFGLALALLAATGLFLAARSGSENLPAREPLAKIPSELDGWVGRDSEIDDDALRVLGDGEFLLRYYNRSPEEPWINLFVAYFPTQRTGSTMHSPQNCLPGAGWLPIQSGRIPLHRPGGEIVTVNRYIIAMGLDRQLVLYWYQSHGRIVASEYGAKIYLVLDSMRYNRSDGALVRVVTPLMRGEEEEKATRRASVFAETILSRMDPFIPR